ncbi:MAG TPA: tetratricopeptide repeat protein [Candidatus Binataceae bacterium]|nr:tetratricopeptide repeat protein [Candidatus Binataceae bacterium]
MATPHYKLDRKELKQPDDFVAFLDQLGEFVVNNLLRVIIGALAVVALIVIFYVVSFYQDHQRRLAADRFYDALTALNHQDYKTAEQGFSALAADNPRQSLGQLARLYLASAYMSENKDKQARTALRDYLASGDQALYRNMALMELGAADENLGDFKAAHDAYTQAADIDGPAKARAQIGVARTLIKQGNTKGGIEAYRQFLNDNPYSPMRNYVIETLATLGVPVESHAGAPVSILKAN